MVHDEFKVRLNELNEFYEHLHLLKGYIRVHKIWEYETPYMKQRRKTGIKCE